jgi:hypothetical protein
MYAFVTTRRLAPLALAVAVTCALGACKKDAAPADAAAGAAPTAQQAPAPTPQSVVAAAVAAMSPDQLRAEASKAYAENRLYAPAGSNAMEYYLALRDKQPGDAGASSALTDLLPMTLIATEQGIAREDFAEAKRLTALIEKAGAASWLVAVRVDASASKWASVVCLLSTLVFVLAASVPWASVSLMGRAELGSRRGMR